MDTPTGPQADHPSLTLLVVEDINHHRLLFSEGLHEAFPDARIVFAEDLATARTMLQTHAFDAVVTDCGFPDDPQHPRVNGNRNGIALISEIRNRQYGKYHTTIPIAFNSVELYPDKIKDALQCGGNTRCFRKGSLYEFMPRGKAMDNFTLGSVTGETVKWLQEELTEDKIQQRKASLVPKKYTGWSWLR